MNIIKKWFLASPEAVMTQPQLEAQFNHHGTPFNRFIESLELYSNLVQETKEFIQANQQYLNGPARSVQPELGETVDNLLSLIGHGEQAIQEVKDWVYQEKNKIFSVIVKFYNEKQHANKRTQAQYLMTLEQADSQLDKFSTRLQEFDSKLKSNVHSIEGLRQQYQAYTPQPEAFKEDELIEEEEEEDKNDPIIREVLYDQEGREYQQEEVKQPRQQIISPEQDFLLDQQNLMEQFATNYQSSLGSTMNRIKAEPAFRMQSSIGKEMIGKHLNQEDLSEYDNLRKMLAVGSSNMNLFEERDHFAANDVYKLTKALNTASDMTQTRAANKPLNTKILKLAEFFDLEPEEKKSAPVAVENMIKKTWQKPQQRILALSSVAQQPTNSLQRLLQVSSLPDTPQLQEFVGHALALKEFRKHAPQSQSISTGQNYNLQTAEHYLRDKGYLEDMDVSMIDNTAAYEQLFNKIQQSDLQKIKKKSVQNMQNTHALTTALTGDKDLIMKNYGLAISKIKNKIQDQEALKQRLLRVPMTDVAYGEMEQMYTQAQMQTEMLKQKEQELGEQRQSRLRFKEELVIAGEQHAQKQQLLANTAERLGQLQQQMESDQLAYNNPMFQFRPDDQREVKDIAAIAGIKFLRQHADEGQTQILSVVEQRLLEYDKELSKFKAQSMAYDQIQRDFKTAENHNQQLIKQRELQHVQELKNMQNTELIKGQTSQQQQANKFAMDQFKAEKQFIEEKKALVDQNRKTLHQQELAEQKHIAEVAKLNILNTVSDEVKKLKDLKAEQSFKIKESLLQQKHTQEQTNKQTEYEKELQSRTEEIQKLNMKILQDTGMNQLEKKRLEQQTQRQQDAMNKLKAHYEQQREQNNTIHENNIAVLNSTHQSQRQAEQFTREKVLNDMELLKNETKKQILNAQQQSEESYKRMNEKYQVEVLERKKGDIQHQKEMERRELLQPALEQKNEVISWYKQKTEQESELMRKALNAERSGFIAETQLNLMDPTQKTDFFNYITKVIKGKRQYFEQEELKEDPVKIVNFLSDISKHILDNELDELNRYRQGVGFGELGQIRKPEAKVNMAINMLEDLKDLDKLSQNDAAILMANKEEVHGLPAVINNIKRLTRRSQQFQDRNELMPEEDQKNLKAYLQQYQEIIDRVVLQKANMSPEERRDSKEFFKDLITKIPQATIDKQLLVDESSKKLSRDVFQNSKTFSGLLSDLQMNMIGEQGERLAKGVFDKLTEEGKNALNNVLGAEFVKQIQKGAYGIGDIFDPDNKILAKEFKKVFDAKVLDPNFMEKIATKRNEVKNLFIGLLEQNDDPSSRALADQIKLIDEGVPQKKDPPKIFEMMRTSRLAQDLGKPLIPKTNSIYYEANTKGTTYVKKGLLKDLESRKQDFQKEVDKYEVDNKPEVDKILDDIKTQLGSQDSNAGQISHLIMTRLASAISEQYNTGQEGILLPQKIFNNYDAVDQFLGAIQNTDLYTQNQGLKNLVQYSQQQIGIYKAEGLLYNEHVKNTVNKNMQNSINELIQGIEGIDKDEESAAIKSVKKYLVEKGIPMQAHKSGEGGAGGGGGGGGGRFKDGSARREEKQPPPPFQPQLQQPNLLGGKGMHSGLVVNPKSQLPQPVGPVQKDLYSQPITSLSKNPTTGQIISKEVITTEQIRSKLHKLIVKILQRMTRNSSKEQKKKLTRKMLDSELNSEFMMTMLSPEERAKMKEINKEMKMDIEPQ